MSDHSNKTREQLEKELTETQQQLAKLEAGNSDFDHESHLATLLDNLPGVSYRCAYDEDWTVTFINTGIKELSGYPDTDFMTNIRSFASLIHPDDVNMVHQTVTSGLDKKQTYTIEYRIIDANNAIKWVYERGKAIFDSQGDLKWLDGVILDITEKKQLELDKQLSEIRFNNIVNASPVPYAFNDENQNITYLNPAFIKTFGYDSSDIKVLDDWWPKAYPDDDYRQWVAETWQTHLEWAQQNHSDFEPIELRIRCKDGSDKIVLASAASLTNDFKGIHQVILVDITEQKLAQTELTKTITLLENIVNSTPDLIFVKDRKLRTIFCNQAYATAVGKTREEMYGNTDIENGWNPELVNGDPENGIRGFKHDDLDALAGKDVHNPHDPANIEGEVRIFDTHKLPLKDSHNNTLGVLGVARDVTERKRTEEQLRHSQKMDALGKLTGGIAHDFNNMLAVILGYAELLTEKTNKDERSSQYIAAINNAAEQAKSLTSKLLTFSRIRASDAKYLNLNNLIMRDQIMLEKSLTSKINLTLNLEDNLWETFLDEEAFLSSVFNICINAMHAMPNGGELTIASQNLQLSENDARYLNLPAANYVQISISDNGIGMDQYTKDHVFDPFFSTKGDSGTGLGMSQVYGFIKQSGGEIQVSSQSGSGTCFTMYFPQSEKTTNQQDNAPIKPVQSPPSGNETILVVEDEPALREYSTELLTSTGYKVICAEDGEVALEILNKEKIDLLLSDVIMPGIDGYQLAAKAQEIQPDMKIQMVSGYNDKHYISDANEQLQKNQLNKPFKSGELLERIRHLLD